MKTAKAANPKVGSLGSLEGKGGRPLPLSRLLLPGEPKQVAKTQDQGDCQAHQKNAENGQSINIQRDAGQGIENNSCGASAKAQAEKSLRRVGVDRVPNRGIVQGLLHSKSV